MAPGEGAPDRDSDRDKAVIRTNLYTGCKSCAALRLLFAVPGARRGPTLRGKRRPQDESGAPSALGGVPS